MDWGRIFFIFFSLMSFAAIVMFLYLGNIIALFCAVAINFLSTTLKIGVKKVLSSELVAVSLVIDCLLIPAFLTLQVWKMEDVAYGFSFAALSVSIFSLALILIESAKINKEEKEYQ